MIVKFFKHGTGNADSATTYLLGISMAPLRYLTGDRNARGAYRKTTPVVVRGDAEQTRRLISQLQSKQHKYISGVLSFREVISPKTEQQIIARFEAAAFAGLCPGQYDCLWIRHCDHQRSELHFLLPRVELFSGKALNIRPPGKQSEELFDVLRTLTNHDFGLKDPTRDVAHFSHATVQAFRDKLDRLVAARAKYNRRRFPFPSVDLNKFPELAIYADRTRSLDSSATAPRPELSAPRPATRPAIERLECAARKLGETSQHLELSGQRLSRAACAFPERLAALAASRRRLVKSRSLFSRYGIPARQSTGATRREIERDEFDSDLSDQL